MQSHAHLAYGPSGVSAGALQSSLNTVTNRVTSLETTVSSLPPPIAVPSTTSTEPTNWTATQTNSVVNKGTVSTGTSTIDASSSNAQKVTIAGPVTLAVDNWPVGAKLTEVIVELVNPGSASVTFPAGVTWLNAATQQTYATLTAYLTSLGRSPAALRASGSEFFCFWSTDGGVTTYGKIL